ncbi:DUF1801 domain-containing protein [Aquiflexum sp. AIY15W]|nr:DUF1801 domain-containing protein [Cognataquiflexum rubidum]
MIKNPMDIMDKLKSIISQTELERTIKWGIDVYTYRGQNILGIAAFKSYVGIWFYNGVFLSDPAQVLVNAQEGKTKSQRQWRFQSIEEINPDLIISYIQEAIENAKNGLKPDIQKSKEIEIPTILSEALCSDEEFNFCFEKLSSYKQKEYSAYIQEAKREATQLTRLEKIKPMIMQGISLNDKYK